MMTFQIHRSMWCTVLQCPRSNLLLSFRLWYYLHRPIPKNSPEIDLSFKEFSRSMSLHRNHEFIRFNVRCLFYQFFLIRIEVQLTVISTISIIDAIHLLLHTFIPTTFEVKFSNTWTSSYPFQVLFHAFEWANESASLILHQFG